MIPCVSSDGKGRLLPWLLGLLCVALLVGAVGCDRSGASSTGLLANKRAVAAQGVRDAARLVDGVVPPEGSGWNSNRTTVFNDRRSYVDFDLGAETDIKAIALMGDNNDTYRVLGSTNGRDYSPLWLAPRARDPGMRWRHTDDVSGRARYVRIQPQQGDNALSIAEFSVYSQIPARLPPQLKQAPASDVALSFRSAAIVAAALLVLASLMCSQGTATATQILCFLLAVGGLGYAGMAYEQAAPLGKVEVGLLRGLTGAAAMAIVLRSAFSPDKYRPVQWVQVSLLGALAALSVAAFFNMGVPQFFDHKLNKPSVVHNYDMRVYFPVAKYFDELKYDGLYLASVASFAEEHGGLDTPTLAHAELRDLRNHRMKRVADLKPEIEAIRGRFSDARWEEFKKDMAYFWETMGTGAYLGSMADHGGNATPVWLTIAHLMYGHAQASNATLLWGAALDPLLLLIFAVFVWRSFGAQTALVSLIVFGANDFYMFGSNWAGATLRNDWMVYLGLGACALKTERYKLGGALLAMSALIRAFPAVSLLALGVPVAHQLIVRSRAGEALPNWAAFKKEFGWFVDVAIGALICVAVSVVGSSLMMGFESWPLWVKKISSFTASPHVNHVGWLTVVAGSEGRQAEVLAQRSLVHVLGIVLYFGLAIWIAARAKPHRIALLGILMMPVFMYPANYYIHFIFVLPLLVADQAETLPRLEREAAGKVWALLLGLCAAQYFTVKQEQLDLHFYNASVLLMAALFLILTTLLPRDAEGRVDFSALPFVKS